MILCACGVLAVAHLLLPGGPVAAVDEAVDQWVAASRGKFFFVLLLAACHASGFAGGLEGCLGAMVVTAGIGGDSRFGDNADLRPAGSDTGIDAVSKAVSAADVFLRSDAGVGESSATADGSDISDKSPASDGTGVL